MLAGTQLWVKEFMHLFEHVDAALMEKLERRVKNTEGLIAYELLAELQQLSKGKTELLSARLKATNEGTEDGATRQGSD